ncbi:MAG: alanyl-tRNA editing protein [Myxococcales bacterium]|nr:alanyl-tRNA editing protein [Myxococcales bacterium]
MKLLPCHADSYQRRLDTEVLACEPGPSGFRITLADTVLYPGGGGQPADGGTIGGARVLDVIEADAPTYVVDAPVPVGPVAVEVDWARRFDHMQQHTAQHLITAIALRDLGLATTAFHLNPERSDVVLATPVVPPDVLADLSARVNAAIRAALPVRARLITEAELAEVRFRRLPGEHDGTLRVVEIEGVDRNTCGGTHVANLAELQLISFIAQENRQGVTRLHWLAGGRALAALDAATAREAELVGLLRCAPAEHPAAVARLLQQSKDQGRDLKAQATELAVFLGEQLAAAGPVGALHRPGGDLAFLNAIARAAQARRPDVLLLLTARAEGPAGAFLIAGPADAVARVAPAIATALGGQGGGRPGVFQGKATRLDQAAAAEALLTA